MPKVRKLLIIEDHRGTAESLETVLKQLGVSIQTAFSAPEGFDVWERETPDIVVLDLELPGGDGMDLLRRSQQSPELCGTVVIVFTASRDRGEEAVRNGAKGFLIKPGHPEQTQAMVDLKIRELPLYRHEGVRQTLSLHLENSQRIGIRSRGPRFINSESDEALRVDVPTYDRDAKNAFASKDWRPSVVGLGKRLFSEVFGAHPNVLGEYRGALEASHQELQVCFEASPGDIRLPLEFLYDKSGDGGDDFMIRNHPMYRSVQGIRPRTNPICPRFLNEFAKSGQKLRVLLLGSNTGDLGAVDQEVADLKELIQREFNNVGVRVEVPTCLQTNEATIYKVREVLAKNRFHILHYAGHSSYEEDRPERSGLWFWENPNAKGQREILTANELRDLLPSSGVQLVYLNSCYGTATGGPDQLAKNFCLGLAHAILCAGVSSVLGHHFPVPDHGAAVLASKFYHALADCGHLSTALYRARREVSTQHSTNSAWLSPVLLQQAEDSIA
jgi:CheY-like chemotaxis protein